METQFFYAKKRRKNMKIQKIRKEEGYTVMSNYHFKDKRLSLKAKGYFQ